MSPTYEYRCNDCDAKTVENKAVDDRDNNPACNNCQSSNTIRTYSSTPIHFKGGGFYSTGN